MSNQPSALNDLRAATTGAHRSLDSGLDVQRRLSSDATRTPLLQGYFAMHSAAEVAMAPYLDHMADLDLPRRRRAILVEQCLQRLDAAPEASTTLPVSSCGEALGVLYVMEGSSLGGRVILRNLADAGMPTDKLGFLDPYGAAAGTMWRDLVAVLERELHHQQPRDAAIAGAVAAFALAGRCLGPKPGSAQTVSSGR